MLCFDEKSYMQYTCGYAPVRSWAIRRLVICIPPKKKPSPLSGPWGPPKPFFWTAFVFQMSEMAGSPLKRFWCLSRLTYTDYIDF